VDDNDFISDDPNKSETIEKKRLRASLRKVVGKHVLLWAYYLGLTNEGRLRGWMWGPQVPRERERDKYLRLLGIDPAMIDSATDDEWDEYLKSLPDGMKPPLEGELPHWLFKTIDLIGAIALTKAASVVIIATIDPQWLLYSSELKNSVKVNLPRGINFLIVVPKDARLRDDLIRWANIVGAQNHPGSVHIMLTEADSCDRIWSLLKSAIFFTRPNLKIAQNALGQIELDDFRGSWWQLYQAGDTILPGETPAIAGGRVWVSMENLTSAVFVNQVREWSAAAKLVSARGS
jgi:hypothetical protein